MYPKGTSLALSPLVRENALTVANLGALLLPVTNHWIRKGSSEIRRSTLIIKRSFSLEILAAVLDAADLGAAGEAGEVVDAEALHVVKVDTPGRSGAAPVLT
mmetsp:Transcript_39529/g.85256  ORF Transcript_39529/g.85256 Transcript_39529/m.85256 type:complete len:102 (-) Transcript_39529:487-792(-)